MTDRLENDLAARLERIRNLELAVTLQTPSDGGLAAQRNQAQICVSNPKNGNEVHAYCGPDYDEEALRDAVLFAAAPAMFMALLAQIKAQEKGSSAAQRLTATIQAQAAISKVLMSVNLYD